LDDEDIESSDMNKIYDSPKIKRYNISASSAIKYKNIDSADVVGKYQTQYYREIPEIEEALKINQQQNHVMLTRDELHMQSNNEFLKTSNNSNSNRVHKGKDKHQSDNDFEKRLMAVTGIKNIKTISTDELGLKYSKYSHINIY
jgi:hypothetical protein